MAFAAFFLLAVVQALVAVIVIVVLKKMLDKELIEAALEKFQGLAAGTEAGEIAVHFGKDNVRAQARFEDLARRRFPQARLTVSRDADLKGGAVIVIGNETLDFSIAARLRDFWS